MAADGRIFSNLSRFCILDTLSKVKVNPLKIRSCRAKGGQVFLHLYFLLPSHPPFWRFSIKIQIISSFAIRTLKQLVYMPGGFEEETGQSRVQIGLGHCFSTLAT